jgi:hypothetical protein
MIAILASALNIGEKAVKKQDSDFCWLLIRHIMWFLPILKVSI